MALKSCAWLKCKALRRMSKRNHCNDPCMHMYIHIDISDSTTPMAAFVNGLHTSSPSALPASGVVSGAHERSHISQIDFMEPVVWHDGSCGPHGLGAAATMSLVSKVPDKSNLLFQGAMFMAEKCPFHEDSIVAEAMYSSYWLSHAWSKSPDISQQCPEPFQESPPKWGEKGDPPPCSACKCSPFCECPRPFQKQNRPLRPAGFVLGDDNP